jgi:hypothetical protein
MTIAYATMKQLLPATVIFLTALAPAVYVQDNLPYTTYTSFSEVLEGSNARYPAIARISDPGAEGRRVYTGFFFYQCLQFDTTGRYLLGMKVHFQNRSVEPANRGDIGFIDLKNEYKWTEGGLHRVDLHPRISRDGRIVSIDATHEGLGRQRYVINISHIVDNPPNRRASVQ